MMKASSTTVKRSVVVIVTILMVLVIIACIGFVLYNNKLLPEGLREYIDSVVIDGKLARGEYAKPLETPFYEIQYELDLPQYKDIEIIDLANQNTLVLGTFSNDIKNKISIIKADNKYGLISNETGEILLEPLYDSFVKDLDNEENQIYGTLSDKTDLINLNTFKVKKDVTIEVHGDESIYYYDSSKNNIWSEEYNKKIEYVPDEKEIEKYENLGSEYAICSPRKILDSKDNNEMAYGYFDIKTGIVKIEPIFEKASLFEFGVAGVVKDGKGYFISENNVRVSDESFEDVSGLHDFKAWIKIDGKWKLAYFPKLLERAEIYESSKKQREEKITTNSVENTTNEVDNTISNETSNLVDNKTEDKNIVEQ